MIINTLAAELGAQPAHIAATIELLDAGNTVPFIARYRKEVTGGLDDSQLRQLSERLTYLRELNERKQVVLAAIREAGKLTEELEREIAIAETKARVEDIYLPFKKRRVTKADLARAAGIEVLVDRVIEDPKLDATAVAEELLQQGAIGEDYPDTKAVLDGGRAIVIDRAALNADLVGEVREHFAANGVMRATVVEGKETEGAKFADYFDFAEDFASLPSHRILALLRGEKEGVLTLNLDAGDDLVYEAMIAKGEALATETNSWLAECVRWAWRTKLYVSSSLDVRMRLRERAEEAALGVFAANLKDVLLTAPAGQRATMGLDPGYRNGVKVAVVDATGKVQATTIVYPHAPQNRWNEALQELALLSARFGVELLAIGNGTASRETEKLGREIANAVAGAGGVKPIPVVVSESGASIYSASELAAQEFPDMDVSLRGAVSIARRLQDPLAELVKIDPKSIGVGQYQHDVNQVALAHTLDGVVEDAVNGVGVDVNTASAPLLSRVAGISATLADNIVLYRDNNGAFTSRAQLKKVPRLGPKAFEQCAGFLRIRGAKDPLDASAVHPEAYEVVRSIAKSTGVGVAELIGNTSVLNSLNPADFANDTFGVPTVKDIIDELDKPGRDPRPEFVTATFKEGIEKLSDVQPGMILEGTVTNVAAFGAFVDVGVHQDGLVHVSAMSRNFVTDPHTVVKSGQVVKVKVLDVDVARKRLSLSLRLDDEPGQDNKQGGNKHQKKSGDRSTSDRNPRSGSTDTKRGAKSRGQAQRNGRGSRTSAAGGSLADALRKAGFGN